MIIIEFDEKNPNWSFQDGQNQFFIEAQQDYANDVLRSKGFITLNEVYEMLGFEQTEKGALAGWVGDVEIRFEASGGIGGETPIRLTFNPNTTNVFRDK